MSTILPEGGLIPSERVLRTTSSALGKGLASGLEGRILQEAIRGSADSTSMNDDHERKYRQSLKLQAAAPFVSEGKRNILGALDPFRQLESQENFRQLQKNRIEEHKPLFISEFRSAFPNTKISDETLNHIFNNKLIKELSAGAASPEQFLSGLRNPRPRSIINFFGNLERFINDKSIELLKPSGLLDQDFSRLLSEGRRLYGDDPIQLENIYRQLQDVSILKGQALPALELFKTKTSTPVPEKFDQKNITEWLEKNNLNPMQAKAELLEQFPKNAPEIQSIMNQLYPNTDLLRLSESIIFSSKAARSGRNRKSEKKDFPTILKDLFGKSAK